MSLIVRFWCQLTLLLLVLITALSLSPLPELPIMPGSDKAHHLLAYAALIFPVALRRPRLWLWFGTGFMLWGGVVELLQPYVNRHAEWLDFMANTLGLLLGFVAASMVRRVTDG